jgi:hypothetical protein
MSASINGFYAAYLTGSDSQGFAMLVFRDGTIVGVDAAGVKFDGTYEAASPGFSVKLRVSVPPNTLLIQGVKTGAEIESSELEFLLPSDFLSQPFLRLNAKHGPVNAKLTKLRDLNDD